MKVIRVLRLALSHPCISHCATFTANPNQGGCAGYLGSWAGLQRAFTKKLWDTRQVRWGRPCLGKWNSPANLRPQIHSGPHIQGTLFWGPYKKHPTIWGTTY